MLPQKLRKRILKKDNWQCIKCHRRHDLQVHHVVPKVSGGTDDESNLVALCLACHEEWHAVETIVKTTFTEWLEVPTLPAYYGWYKFVKELICLGEMTHLSSTQVVETLDIIFKLSKEEHREAKS